MKQLNEIIAPPAGPQSKPLSRPLSGQTAPTSVDNDAGMPRPGMDAQTASPVPGSAHVARSTTAEDHALEAWIRDGLMQNVSMVNTSNRPTLMLSPQQSPTPCQYAAPVVEDEHWPAAPPYRSASTGSQYSLPSPFYSNPSAGGHMATPLPSAQIHSITPQEHGPQSTMPSQRPGTAPEDVASPSLPDQRFSSYSGLRLSEHKGPPLVPPQEYGTLPSSPGPFSAIPGYPAAVSTVPEERVANWNNAERHSAYPPPLSQMNHAPPMESFDPSRAQQSALGVQQPTSQLTPQQPLMAWPSNHESPAAQATPHQMPPPPTTADSSAPWATVASTRTPATLTESLRPPNREARQLPLSQDAATPHLPPPQYPRLVNQETHPPPSSSYTPPLQFVVPQPLAQGTPAFAVACGSTAPQTATWYQLPGALPAYLTPPAQQTTPQTQHASVASSGRPQPDINPSRPTSQVVASAPYRIYPNSWLPPPVNHGLFNQGEANCFLNVVIQALANAPMFRAALRNAPPHVCSRLTCGECITCEVARLMHDFNTLPDRATISPYGLRRALANNCTPSFAMNREGDATECFNKILDAVHAAGDSFGRCNPCIAHRVFGMPFLRVRKCIHCAHEDHRAYSRVWDLACNATTLLSHPSFFDRASPSYFSDKARAASVDRDSTCSRCGKESPVNRCLLGFPEMVVISLAWAQNSPQRPPSIQEIRAFAQQLSEFISINRLFEATDSLEQRFGRLEGLTGFLGGHFVGVWRRGGGWILFNDDKFFTVARNLQELTDYLGSGGGLAPIALYYSAMQNQANPPAGGAAAQSAQSRPPDQTGQPGPPPTPATSPPLSPTPLPASGPPVRRQLWDAGEAMCS